jgi:hypothetical protein
MQPQHESAAPTVTVFLSDHTGNKRRRVKLDFNAPAGTLTRALVSALDLPMFDPEGHRVAYHLVFDNRQMTANETLRTAGVVEGADITLLPEPVAGGVLP